MKKKKRWREGSALQLSSLLTWLSAELLLRWRRGTTIVEWQTSQYAAEKWYCPIIIFPSFNVQLYYTHIVGMLMDGTIDLLLWILWNHNATIDLSILFHFSFCSGCLFFFVSNFYCCCCDPFVDFGALLACHNFWGGFCQRSACVMHPIDMF